MSTLTSSPHTFAQQWAAAESRYLDDGYRGAGAPDELDTTTGTRPVLFTAPHAVSHPRNGGVKPADMYTGGLAITLAQALDAHAIVVAGPPSKDGNFESDGPFKAALHETLPQVAAVIDLHGMRDTWDVDVCIGRGAVPELSSELVQHLEHHLTEAGFSVGVNAPFDATRPTTVTTSAQRSGTPAVQIEIARSSRDPRNLDRAHALAAAIAAAVDAFATQAA